MGQQNEGLTNAEYASWLSNTAIEEYSQVEEIFIRYINDDEQTLTNQQDIYNFMANASETIVATYNEVVFSGTDGDQEPWYASDERVSVNLERTENNGVVPVKIRRPKGK